MTRLLILAASIGFAVSQASACNYAKSVSNVDSTKVASVSNDGAGNMSRPVTQPAPSADAVKNDTVPVLTE